MGTQLPLPKKGAEPSPQFSTLVHCGQTAGWIKTTLSAEVGLGTKGHIALDAVVSSVSCEILPPLICTLYMSWLWYSVVVCD